MVQSHLKLQGLLLDVSKIELDAGDLPPQILIRDLVTSQDQLCFIVARLGFLSVILPTLVIIQGEEKVHLSHLDGVLAKQSFDYGDVEQHRLLFLLLLADAAKQESGLSEQRQQLVSGLTKHIRVILVRHRFVTRDVTVLEAIDAGDVFEAELVRTSHYRVLDFWPQQSALNVVLANGQQRQMRSRMQLVAEDRPFAVELLISDHAEPNEE